MKNSIRSIFIPLSALLWMMVLPMFVLGNSVKDDEDDKIEECDSARTACFAKADTTRQNAKLANLAQHKKCIEAGNGLDSCQRAFDDAQKKVENAYTRDTSACREEEKKCKGDTNELSNPTYWYVEEMESTKTSEDDSCDVKRKLCEIDADSALAQAILDAKTKLLECMQYRPGRDGRISCLIDAAHKLLNAQEKNEKDKEACLEKYPEKDESIFKISSGTTSFPIRIYPNPSNEDFIVKMGVNAKEICIMDSQGRIVERRSDFGDSSAHFKLEEPGVYLVNITLSSGEVVSDRVVIIP